MRINCQFYFKAFISGLTVLLLSSCSSGKHASLTVQLCVQNDSGLSHFKQTLQAIASDEKMRYVDGSKATARKLERMGVTGKDMHTDGDLVHIGITGDNGIGLTAGNMGLNDYDIAVGFSTGRDADAGRVFSDKVTARLQQRWELELVPGGSGAFPNPDCARYSGAPPNNSFNPLPLRGTG